MLLNTKGAPMTTQSNQQNGSKDRQIRVFISSTFRDPKYVEALFTENTQRSHIHEL